MYAATGSDKPFVHPGLLSTQIDFDRMKLKVAEKDHPWIDSWDILIANPHAQLTWQPHAVPIVYRGSDGVHGENYAQLMYDAAAAYQTALRWKISGDTAYADKSVQILNAWGATLTHIGGDSNACLALGFYGYEMACAAEIMRGYSGWAPADFTKFQSMMLNVFYTGNHDFLVRHNGTCVSHYWANWDLANLDSMIAIGVLCDRRDIYDEAVDYFKTGVGNGCIEHAVYYMHPGYSGQWQEAGRDQGHTTLGVSLIGVLCEIAWNQGDDLYSYDNNRVLAGAEYIAKYNLMNDVPYLQYTNCQGVVQPTISASGRGDIRPCWDLIFNHYVNIEGIAAPYVTQFAAKVRPEGGGGNYGPNSGGFDQLGFGTLTATVDPVVQNEPPTGLTAAVQGRKVNLTWWGSEGAAEYIVRRGSTSAGPFTTVGTTTANFFVDTNASSDHSLYYKIVAVWPSGRTAASNGVSASLSPKLVADLSFDEESGTTAADSSGNGNNAVLADGASVVADKVGHAVQLDGTEQYVKLPDDVVSGLTDFTVSTWIYLNSEPRFSRVFDFGNGEISYMFLTPAGNTGKVRFAITAGGGNSEQIIDGAAALPMGVWTHVAVTENAGVGTLYVNGVAVGANPSMKFTPADLGRTWNNYLGKSEWPNAFLNARICDFRIYSGALTAQQVANLALSR